MKKSQIIMSAIFGAILLIAPTPAFAAINSLGGLVGATQTFATTSTTTAMHMKIVSVGTTHEFRWDSTAWRLNQGGTGAVSFATGTIPFILNGIFSENNSQLFWDNTNTSLGLGTTTGLSKLTVKSASTTQAILNIITSTAVNALYIDPTGKVGIGTASPTESLEVLGNVKVSGTTTAATFTTTSTIASSTFANGLNLTKGCFSVNGTCIGSGSNLTNIPASTTVYSTAGNYLWVVPSNLSYLVVEVIGAGGAGANNFTAGTAGGSSSFGGIIISTGGAGGGVGSSNESVGGTGSGGDLNLSGQNGGILTSPMGGSAARGSGGGSGGVCGGGKSGSLNNGSGGAGGGYASKLITATDSFLAGTSSPYIVVGSGGTGPVGSGGDGCVIITAYFNVF